MVDTCPVLFDPKLMREAIKRAKIPLSVHMRAYDVYCKKWGPQLALIEDGYRGGFSLSELIVCLYAASFPEEEWPDRVDEAWRGMEGI